MLALSMMHKKPTYKRWAWEEEDDNETPTLDGYAVSGLGCILYGAIRVWQVKSHCDSGTDKSRCKIADKRTD